MVIKTAMKNFKKLTILAMYWFFLCCVTGICADKSSAPDNSLCPVHGIRMKTIMLRVVYGMPSRLEFEEMRVAKSLFPHGRDYVLAGCVVGAEKFRNGVICSECVKARQAWLASKEHWNRISKASQASLEEFFAIVNSLNVDEAIKSMSPKMIDTAEKISTWRRQLSAIRSIHILDLEPAQVHNWDSSRHIFKVTLEAYVENSPDAPIPFFGWHDNPNVRWVTMALNSHRRWVVAEIATGP